MNSLLACRTGALLSRGLLLLAFLLVRCSVQADSISFSPAEGNALTPMTITVSGFIGTNGPAPVSIGGASIADSCGTARPCVRAANMGYYSGKHWVVASAVVDGVNVVVSNFFIVRTAGAFINRACGTNGTKVLVTGYDFARNSIISVDSIQTQADAEGKFTAKVTIPEGTSGTFKIIAHDGTRFVTNEFVISPTAEICDEEVGHVREIQGHPTIQSPNGLPVPLKPGDPVHFGDLINSGAEGRVDIYFGDETELVLAKNAKMRIDEYVFDPAATANNRAGYSFLEGLFRYTSGLISSKPNPDVRVNTPIGGIGIRGTEFIARRDPCSTTQEVYLIHGQLAITPTNSTVTNLISAPAIIYFDTTNVWTNTLTQTTYDELLATELNQINPLTFADWQVQYFGCTNDNPAALATADPDADGQNNYHEFLSRTDPTASSSVFKLLGAAREGDGVRVSWQTHGGVTNTVQAAGNLEGIYTNLSPEVVIPNDTDTTTNYFDTGAITNSGARFYRIKLVQ